MDLLFQNILEPSETITWQGKINRKVLNTFFVISLVVFAAIAIYIWQLNTIQYTSGGVARQIGSHTAAIAVFAVFTFFSVLNYWSNCVKEYALTSKRIIIKSGIIGTDFASIHFEQIQNIIIDVGLVGKIFGVGTIKIDTGKTETYSTGGTARRPGAIRTRTMYDYLKDIDNPYDVYKILQSTLSSRKESLFSGRADRETLEVQKKV